MTMKEQTPKTIYLKDYTPPEFIIDSIDLHFDLDETATTVKSSMRMRRSAADKSPLILAGQDQDLISIVLDGNVLSDNDYRIDDESLTIDSLPGTFLLEITSRINPKENSALEGLYLSSGNFCTQCEAEGFRRITYYLDRPDVMSLFTTTLVANKERYPVLLSNGNLVDSGELEGGRHWARWQDPFKKPCYLFALVAGNLSCIEDEFVTRSGRRVRLRIYVEAHNIKKCDHAMRSLKRSMQWDEEAFGREYDLDIYMIVAVDDFNMGAMENKGLNVFNSKFVLADPDTATDTDYLNIEGVIGHEYFHNWSGNRVTCRDWFQLSLKEGFTVFRDQEFSGDMFSHPVKRIEEVNQLRSMQFTEDAGPMAHPIRPESYVEINNFYTLTVYEKGAEVVRMIRTLVGNEGFRRGSDLYFDRHDGQAVTTEDFVAAMEDANKIDLSLFKRWYGQAGTPVVKVVEAYDAQAKSYTLKFQQTCPATPGQATKLPFHIPIVSGLLDETGRSLPLQLVGEASATSDSRVLELRDAEQTFVFANIKKRPVPSLNRHFSAPIKLEFAYTDSDLAFLMANDSDEFNRWDAGQQLALRVIKGLVEQWQCQARFDLSALGELVQTFFDAYECLLHDESTDKSLLAEALTLPKESYICDFVHPVDPEAIHGARWHLMQELARRFSGRLEVLYNKYDQGSHYSIAADAIGKRRMRNLSMALLGTLGDEAGIARCYRQFQRADNMTDVMAALSSLSHIECFERQQAFDAFYRKWQQQPLVVDKWLMLQALSSLPDTVHKVIELQQHPAFNIRNPNKVRSLIGAFAQGNLVRFHQADGEGYKVLADAVATLNSLNPQVAARILSPLIHWRRYGAERQALMQAQLQKLLALPGLSKDLYEVVNKALVQAA